jgi:hypothetical protein
MPAPVKMATEVDAVSHSRASSMFPKLPVYDEEA